MIVNATAEDARRVNLQLVPVRVYLGAELVLDFLNASGDLSHPVKRSILLKRGGNLLHSLWYA